MRPQRTRIFKQRRASNTVRFSTLKSAKLVSVKLEGKANSAGVMNFQSYENVEEHKTRCSRYTFTEKNLFSGCMQSFKIKMHQTVSSFESWIYRLPCALLARQGTFVRILSHKKINSHHKNKTKVNSQSINHEILNKHLIPLYCLFVCNCRQITSGRRWTTKLFKHGKYNSNQYR